MIDKEDDDIYQSFSSSMITKKKQISKSLNSYLSSTVSKIGEIKTNLLYSVKQSELNRKQIQIKKQGTVRLLGKTYDYETAHYFLFRFRNTFWFTYRKGIKQIQSDNGWGCMIRTIQMIFAQVLRRHLLIKDTESNQLQVIRYFCQQADGVLSLSAICQEGKIQKRWTSSLQIFAVFRNIMKNNPKHCNFDFQIYSSGITYKNKEQMLFQQYPALISLSNRISIDGIPQEYRPHYFHLMKHHTWVGSVGGIQGQALYIIGSQDQKVIFLDPHYVQDNNDQLDIQTYFCRTPRGIDISVLSPSLSFCYYFKTKDEHLQWIDWISKSCQEYYPNLVFEYISQQTKRKLQGDHVKQTKQKQCISEGILLSPPDQLLQQMQLQIVSKQQSSGQFQLLQ